MHRWQNFRPEPESEPELESVMPRAEAYDPGRDDDGLDDSDSPDMNTATAPRPPGSQPISRGGSDAGRGAPAAPPAPMSPEQVRESLASKFVCPFCGAV